MPHRRGEELEAMGGGRGTDEHVSGLLGLWETFGGGVGFQIPWEGAHSFK